jgi:predicted ATPase
MDFLESVAVEVVAAIVGAGVLAALGWLGTRLFRRRKALASASTEGPSPSPRSTREEKRPLCVLVALPRPLLTLLREENGEWVAATGWDKVTGSARILPLRREWKIEAIEQALRESGASLEVRFLHHPTEAALRRALSGPGVERYDALVVDTHGDPDGTLCFEGPHGETHPLPPADLGRLLAGSGVRLALLSACYSAAAGDALRQAGVPAVVGMADSVPEDAACAYLGTFLARLARGDRLDKAHERACGALRTRWEKRAGEAELPRLLASRRQRRCRLAQPGVTGSYVRLSPAGQAGALSPPPALTVQLRGRELDQVLVQRALLISSLPEGVSPMVTLVGFGGVGKTALALAVARWCWERHLFPGGVRFVSLVDLRVAEGETLADRLSRELELPPPQPEAQDAYHAQVSALCAALSGGTQLLILDNFETAAAGDGGGCDLALLAELRRRCPDLHLLVTCRHALDLSGARLHRLYPLAEAPAVEVFCDRAREVGETVRRADWAVVDAICDLLDRVPLHIRLVASHARAESPAAILEGLHDAERRYHLTRASLPDEGAHHQSQELSLRYTGDLLSAGGRRMWAVLAAVFSGDPDRAAVRAVYGPQADGALDELLAWLVVERDGPRHRMAEAVREFGRARFEDGDLALDVAALRARHAAHYLDVAWETFTKEKYQQGEWAAAEEAVGADVFAAAGWAVDELERAAGAPVEALLARWDELGPGDGEQSEGERLAGKLAHALKDYVYRRRPPGGFRWLAGGLAAWRLSGAEEARARQALLCNEFGLIHKARGDYAAALEWYEKSVAIKEALGDRAGLATSYNNIASVHYARGDYAAALEWYEKSVAIQEALGDRAGLATTLHNMGHVALARGDLHRALDLFTRSRDVYAALGLDKDVAEEEEMIAEVRRRMKSG